MSFLAPQSLESLIRFYLVLETSMGLAISFIVGRAEFISREIATNFSKCSFWKVVISFQRY